MLNFTRDDKTFNYRVAGVALREGQVLLSRMERDDFWVLPGGRCEFLEPSAEALAREMREELETEVEVQRLLWLVENFFTYEGRSYHEMALYFAMGLPEGSAPARARAPFFAQDGDARLIFEWHDLATLGEVPLFPRFLRTSLQALPSTMEHLVLRESD